jgi:CheY-like chemotaxis protein
LVVTFNPVRRAARSLADRLVYGRRATSYDVLADFSEHMAETYATDDVLPRMAQILAGATGATRATVWLLVGGQLRPAATDGVPLHPGQRKPAALHELEDRRHSRLLPDELEPDVIVMDVKMPRLDGMNGSYLGPSYNDDECASRLKQAGASFVKLEDEQLIVEVLAHFSDRGRSVAPEHLHDVEFAICERDSHSPSD